jgi:predicted ATP-grasp superfamily ATP-dependent carboligase
MVEGFVDRIGCPIARFVRQRLRMFPPDFGDSTYMVSVPLDRVRGAIESLDRLFAHLSYRGVFEAEFKYDDRDGQFKLLEVNARPWYFIGFAAECGVDLCEMAYWDALGISVDPVTTYKGGPPLCRRRRPIRLLGTVSSEASERVVLAVGMAGAIRSPDSHESFSTFGL